MNFSAKDKIRECRSIRELSELWKSNVKAWSQLPQEQAKELIRVKDSQKAELLFQSNVDRVVSELNKIWSRDLITMEDIPQDRRDRALELDAEMTAAVKRGDYDKARVALDKWRVCWVNVHPDEY